MAEDKATTQTTQPPQEPQEAPGLAALNPVVGSPPSDNRQSDEWDASKVPPSRFQKRKGSIYSTPGSRDGHVDSNYASKFHAKHEEKGYHKVK